jgi:hypothetical protein
MYVAFFFLIHPGHLEKFLVFITICLFNIMFISMCIPQTEIDVSINTALFRLGQLVCVLL